MRQASAKLKAIPRPGIVVVERWGAGDLVGPSPLDDQGVDGTRHSETSKTNPG